VVRHSSVLVDPANNSSAATVVVLELTLSSFSRTLFHIDSASLEAEASPLSAVMVAMVVACCFVSVLRLFVVSKASSGTKVMFRSRL
jgi:hypothetical protein